MQFFGGGKEEAAEDALSVSMRAMELYSSHGPLREDDHKHWYQEALKYKTKVKVSEPETRGSYLKKHTTYLVTEEISNSRVRRRYSDFEWLQTVLRARYLGMLIPSLPEKNMITTQSFIQSRIRGLTLFLEHVLQSPYLRSDASVVCFFSKTDETEWEAAKKHTSVMENAGEGHLRWMRCLSMQESRGSCDSSIFAFKRHLEQLERVLCEIVNATKRIAEKSAAINKDIATLCTCFNTWKVTEATFQEVPDAGFLQLVGETTTVLNGWSNITRYQPAIYDLLVYEHLKYLLQQTRDFRDILHQREVALTSGGCSTNPSEASSSAPSSSSSSSSGSSYASMFAARFRNSDVSAAQLDHNLRRSQHLADMITRALFAQEMERFYENKSQVVHDFMSHFACGQAQLTKRSSSLWKDFLKEKQVHKKEIVSKTKDILESASVATVKSTSSEEEVTPTSAAVAEAEAA